VGAKEKRKKWGDGMNRIAGLEMVAPLVCLFYNQNANFIFILT
jgi:hypothetical protein